MTHQWHTAWLGDDIVVYRDGVAVEQLRGEDIRRVVFVTRGTGPTSDVVHAIVDLGADLVLLAPETGIAGRVHFERQAFWAPLDCVYWIDERDARLPLAWRFGRRFLERGARPACRRLPRAELESAMARWPLQGPMSWQQREWQRLVQRRPMAAGRRATARHPMHEDIQAAGGRA